MGVADVSHHYNVRRSRPAHVSTPRYFRFAATLFDLTYKCVELIFTTCSQRHTGSSSCEPLGRCFTYAT